jgi:hypothetical protein
MRPHPVPDRVPRGRLLDAQRIQPDWPHVEVMFTDSRWRPAMIMAWCRNRGGWAVLVRWPDGTEDWLAYDARYLRRTFDHLGGWTDE